MQTQTLSLYGCIADVSRQRKTQTIKEIQLLKHIRSNKDFRGESKKTSDRFTEQSAELVSGRGYPYQYDNQGLSKTALGCRIDYFSRNKSYYIIRVLNFLDDNYYAFMELNTIYCMDALIFLKQIPDNSVDLVVTDPPYNVSQKTDLKFNGRIIKKNFGDWDFGFDPKPILAELRRVLKPTGQIYIFCGTEQIPIYMQEFIEKWYFRNLLVWYKTNPPPRMSKTNFLFANEYIVYAIKEKGKPSLSTFNFSSQSTMHNTFVSGALQGKERLKNKDGTAMHPTQKPLVILKKLIEVSSKEGDIVLDPFMGIGSTAVACKEKGRNFLGCELNKKYYDEARKRISMIMNAQFC